MELLAGRTIAVIGAAGGIGMGLVAELTRQGGQVHALGRSADSLRAIPSALAGWSVLDLDEPKNWQAAIDTLPLLDGFVVCSGKLNVAPFRTLTAEKFAESMHVNVTGPAMLLRALLRSGKLRTESSVVFIGSIAAIRAIPGNLSYATGKAALHGLVRNLALELAPQRIRVNLVSPGLVLAGMGAGMRSSITEEQLAQYAKRYPLGLGRPEDVAGPVTYLLSELARWVTGQDHVADGGATLS